MKKTMIRFLLFLLISTFVLSAFAGCTDDGTVDTSQTESQQTDDTSNNSLNLNDYCIIVPYRTLNESVVGLVAYELKAMLADLGYSVQVMDDNSLTEEIGEKCILLGKTTATADEIPEGSAYVISEKNGTIQISAGNYYGYSAAIRSLKTKIKQNNGFPKGLEETYTATVTTTQKADGTLRVMFYNVFYGNFWYTPDKKEVKGAQAPSVELRQDLQRDFLSAHSADVVGFQEYASKYKPFGAIMTSLGYTEVPVTNTSDNRVPMFYRVDRVTLVENGYADFASATESAGKGFTWAVFKENETDKLFAVFNTHFMWNKDDDTERWDAMRENDAREILVCINSVKEKYPDIPIIMGGDLNTASLSETSGTESTRRAYEVLTHPENGQLTLVSNIEGVITSPAKSFHGYYRYDGVKKIYDMSQSTLIYAKQNPYSLDHVFVGGDLNSIDISRYIIVEDEITKRASDHSPSFVDFTLG